MTTIAALTTVQIHHARKAKAIALESLLAAEYPVVRMYPEISDESGQLIGWAFAAGDDVFLQTGSASVPALADVLEAAEEAGIDPEAEAEEEAEDKAPASIVPERYRVIYALASTTGQSCGDWLAERLTEDTHGADGFLPDAFRVVLQANGVAQDGAWARLPESGQKGWVGRWRMNGRQALEKMVVLTGVYHGANGLEYVPATGWLEAKRAHHAKWIAKQAKITAALMPDA